MIRFTLQGTGDLISVFFPCQNTGMSSVNDSVRPFPSSCWAVLASDWGIRLWNNQSQQKLSDVMTHGKTYNSSHSPASKLSSRMKKCHFTVHDYKKFTNYSDYLLLSFFFCDKSQSISRSRLLLLRSVSDITLHTFQVVENHLFYTTFFKKHLISYW